MYNLHSNTHHIIHTYMTSKNYASINVHIRVSIANTGIRI